MMLRIILITVFSLFLTGCIHFGAVKERKWPEPEKPQSYPMHFVVVNSPSDGLFIDKTTAKNLEKNIAELDAYIAKLEILVKEMKEYYKVK